MERRTVDSSAIRSVAHDPTTNELELEFRNGSVYRYSMVPASVVTALLEADSIGAFVNRMIVPSYPAREVFQDEPGVE